MRTPPFSLAADSNSGARKKTDNPKFYTIEQIAECTGSSERTVRRWIEQRWLMVQTTPVLS